jgi:methionyl-tRNA synthetase
MREIMKLADKANQYIDEHKPWQLVKEEGKEAQVHDVASLAINLFRVLMTYLKPVLPVMAEQVEVFLNIDSLNWQDIKHPLTKHKINKFKTI